MDRRKFLNVATFGAAASIARADGIGMRDLHRKIEAVAFDGFAIFDPRPIGGMAESVFPGRGADLMAVWRMRQFEYCWLRTLTGSYVDFWQVTQDALAFACASLKVELTAGDSDRLMETHLRLKPWPDVVKILQRLHTAGIRLAFLTNFTGKMLDANIRSGGLEEFFEARLSTDRVSAFKPDPRSYQMAVGHFSLPREAIAFVAFGGWDAAGAKRFGYPVYWCNRLGQPAEELGARADGVANNLELLPAFVATR